MAERDLTIRLSLKDGDAVRRGLMRLGADGQDALKRIEHQSRPASKGLLAVNAVTSELQGGMQAFGQRLGAVGSGLAAMGPAGLAAAAGIAAITVGLTALLRQTRQVIQELGELQDTAENLDVGVETLQEWRFAFQQAGVDALQLETAIQRLGRRAGTVARGGGSEFKKAFDELGVSVTRADGSLKSLDELLPEVADGLANVSDQGRRLSLIQALMDTEGVKLIGLLQQGSAALDEQARKARELGVVLDREMVQRAAEASEQLDIMQRVIDVNLSSALVDLAPLLIDIAEGFADVARWISEVVDGFRAIENISTRGLQSKMDEISADLGNVNREIAALESGGTLTPMDKQRRDALVRERDELYAEGESVLQELMRRDAARNQQAATAVGGGGANPEAEKIKEVTDALRFELEQLDRTAYGKRVFQELQSAGIDGDHAQAQSIAALVRQIQDKEEATKAAEEAEKERQNVEKEGIRVTEQHRTAQEEYAATIEDLDVLLAQNAITSQTYARAVEAAERRKLTASEEASDGIRRALQSYSEDVADSARGLEAAATSSFRSLEDTLVDVAATGKASFSDMTNAIIADLARVGIRQTITGPLATALFSAFHEGGTVGGAAPGYRAVSPLAFAAAPRLHGGGVAGLRADEVPIIAQRGERVLTEAQSEATSRSLMALARMAARPPQVTVVPTVHLRAPGVQARTQASTGQGGEVRLDVIVEEVEQRMGRNISQGDGLAPTLENTYGLNRAAGAVR